SSMTTGMELTEEQQRLADPATEVFSEACPGSGKTRAILARAAALISLLPPRFGIAVLSFTNSAVDEFLERAARADLAHRLRFPTFVGTFDAFVRTFLMLPVGMPGCAV